MRSKIKFLALMLALLMAFTSCEQIGGLFGGEKSSESESQTVVSTEEATTKAATTETATTAVETTLTTAIATTETTELETTETVTETETATETETVTETETETLIPYRDSISRTHEEIKAMLTITDEAYTIAENQLAEFESIALASTDMEAIDAVYLLFEESYDYISTQVSVASVIYYIDMSDEAAYERYNTLYDKYGELYNSYIASCKNIYNNSAVRDELFADWTEEEINQMLNYSPESQELTVKNDELTNELNNLPSAEFKDRSAEIYAELVTNYNRIAELAGYDNYYDYATKEIYGREYGREELEQFCKTVAEEYAPYLESLYNSFYTRLAKLDNIDYNRLLAFLDEPFDKLSENYLEEYIDSLPESMKAAMEHPFANRNVVFSDRVKSHPTAFQTYLDDLDMPLCFFGSSGQSTNTIIHEFGHYYASLYKDVSSYDLAEVQSQGNEMLLLDFLKDKMSSKLYNALKSYTMYSSMTTIVACAIIDEFEREVYSLESVEGFTSADFDAIMNSVCEKYGGALYIKNNLTDMNNYWRQVATNNPVYYISYGVSMTSALNVYYAAKTDRAAGIEAYRILVEENTDEDTYLTALKKAGLPSPFEQTAIDQVISVVWGRRPTIKE